MGESLTVFEGSQMFKFNPDRCVGCMACVVACQQEHRLPSAFRPLKITRTFIDGQFPRYIYGIKVCLHCLDPPCREACPAGAITVQNGAALLDPALCQGCGNCREACPHGAVEMDPQRGLPVKCDCCPDRHGLLPACVQTCPVSALIFDV